ncbi:MAG TPA: hypothetical protein GX726_01165 [Clostridiales bacterium]|nr:hypothetical protein [Clostridiales bacterium]
MVNDGKDREITFELVEHIGIISRDSKGWTRELNRVSWNGGPAKFDIRSWDEAHAKMGRGITMTQDEVRELRNLFDGLEL